MARAVTGLDGHELSARTLGQELAARLVHEIRVVRDVQHDVLFRFGHHAPHLRTARDLGGRDADLMNTVRTPDEQRSRETAEGLCAYGAALCACAASYTQ